MDDLALNARVRFPDALRVLLDTYPREIWEGHTHFAGIVAFWMDRHMMFRKLCEALREDAEAVVDARMDAGQYANRLSRLGGALIQNLHSHHQIEDMHYFPKLMGLETRLSRGFDILDKDHHAMDGLLNRLTNSANDVLQGQAEPGAFHTEILAFQGLLLRHLEDEEDLVVPVILKHGPDKVD